MHIESGSFNNDNLSSFGLNGGDFFEGIEEPFTLLTPDYPNNTVPDDRVFEQPSLLSLIREMTFGTDESVKNRIKAEIYVGGLQDFLLKILLVENFTQIDAKCLIDLLRDIATDEDESTVYPQIVDFVNEIQTLNSELLQNQLNEKEILQLFVFREGLDHFSSRMLLEQVFNILKSAPVEFFQHTIFQKALAHLITFQGSFEFIFSQENIDDELISKLVPCLQAYVDSKNSQAQMLLGLSLLPETLIQTQAETLYHNFKEASEIGEQLGISKKEILAFAAHKMGDLRTEKAADYIMSTIDKISKLPTDCPYINRWREFVFDLYLKELELKKEDHNVRHNFLAALLCTNSFEYILNGFFSPTIETETRLVLFSDLQLICKENSSSSELLQVLEFISECLKIEKELKGESACDLQPQERLQLIQLGVVFYKPELYVKSYSSFKFNFEIFRRNVSLKPLFNEFLKKLSALVFSEKDVAEQFKKLLSLPLEKEDIAFICSQFKALEEAGNNGSKTLSKVFKRYKQLQKIPYEMFEKTKMHPKEELSHAYFMEVSVVKVKDAAQPFFSNLAQHDLQVDFARKVMYLSSNALSSVYVAAGSFKTAVKVVAIPFKRTLQLETFVRTYTHKTIDNNSLKATEEEAQLLKKYQGLRGIVSLIHDSPFIYDTDGKKGLSLIFEEFDASMDKVADGTIALSLQDKLMAMKDIFYGLLELHEDKRVHGDLKPRNMLIRQKGLKGAICDLGLSFPISILVGNQYVAQGLYHYGYYGTFYYTAPELFGMLRFQGDHYKVELFALGVSMYELRFGRLPSWAGIIYAQYEGNFHKENRRHICEESLNQARDQVVQCLKKEVWENPDVLELFRKKEEGRPLSNEESYDWLMYQFLLPVDSRLSLQDAILFVEPPL